MEAFDKSFIITARQRPLVCASAVEMAASCSRAASVLCACCQMHLCVLDDSVQLRAHRLLRPDAQAASCLFTAILCDALLASDTRHTSCKLMCKDFKCRHKLPAEVQGPGVQGRQLALDARCVDASVCFPEVSNHAAHGTVCGTVHCPKLLL